MMRMFRVASRVAVLLTASAVAGAGIAYLVSFNVALMTFTRSVIVDGRRDFLFDPSLVGAYIGAATAVILICARK